MLSALAFLIATQVPIEQPARLRKMLPNGALVLVERVPHAKSLIVDLFVSSRGTEETPETHGRRHLLEHLVALGPDGQLDSRLESGGAFLRARTLRGSTAYEMSFPPTSLKLALAALKDLVAAPTIDEAGIAREASLIDQEGALRDMDAHASEAAWDKAFGPVGLDPFGSMDILQRTTTANMVELRNRAFSADNLLIVVSGDVELDGTINAVTDVVGLLPVAKPDKGPTAAKPKSVVVHQGAGEYRGVPVPGFRSPLTAATLAAALAVAVEANRGTVIYTPSARPGLVLLGDAEGKLDDAINHANPATLFKLGRVMAIRWVQARMAEPAEQAAFRGMLMVDERDLKPETMLENLDALKFSDFQAALQEFKTAGHDGGSPR